MDSESSTTVPFYEGSTDELRQGDIVRDVIFGTPIHELVICRPKSGGKGNECLTSDRKGTERPKAFSKDGGIEVIHAGVRPALGLIVWADCQLDYLKNRGRKNGKAIAAIAPVLPLSKLEPNLWQRIRQGERPALFFLPASDDLINEGFDAEGAYVDLRHIWPLKQLALQSRVTTLSTHARTLLIDHIFWFLTASKALKFALTCPKCNTEFSPSIPFEELH